MTLSKADADELRRLVREWCWSYADFIAFPNAASAHAKSEIGAAFEAKLQSLIKEEPS